MHPYETLFEEAFKHQIRMNQNKAQFVRFIERLVHNIERSWQDRLLSAASQLSGADIQRLRFARTTGSVRLNAFIERIREFVADLSLGLRSEMTTELQDVAEYEGMFWADRYKGFLGEVPELRVDLNENTKRSARANILGGVITGIAYNRAFGRYRQSRATRLIKAVTDAAQADGQRGILSLFRVSRRDRSRGRIFGESIRTLRTFAGDAHTHAVSSGAKAVVDQNDWLDSVWTAMMDNGRPGIDGKTSNICISRNGKLVNRDLGGLIPPAHINCRSQIFPTVDYKSLTRAQKKGLDKDTRQALQGGLPDAQSSTEAFKALSAADQKELLGATRFKLFQDGELSFPRDFINSRTEKRYTLDQIASREGIDLTDFR